jgi:hypothetical protein
MSEYMVWAALTPEEAQAIINPRRYMDTVRGQRQRDLADSAKSKIREAMAEPQEVRDFEAEKAAILRALSIRSEHPSETGGVVSGSAEIGKHVTEALQRWVDHHKAEQKLYLDSDDADAAKQHGIAADAFEDAIRYALGAIVDLSPKTGGEE